MCLFEKLIITAEVHNSEENEQVFIDNINKRTVNYNCTMGKTDLNCDIHKETRWRCHSGTRWGCHSRTRWRGHSRTRWRGHSGTRWRGQARDEDVIQARDEKVIKERHEEVIQARSLENEMKSFKNKGITLMELSNMLITSHVPPTLLPPTFLLFLIVTT